MTLHRSPRKADSLDRVEMLMWLEEDHPELAPAFDTLWDLDPDFDEQSVVPLEPYVCKTFSAKAIRGGILTHVTVFARHRDRVMGLDHDCRQLAIGTLTADRSMREVRHYRTLEMALRAFVADAQRRATSDR